MPDPALPYLRFYYPLNVFMHILTHEEGTVAALHYGLWEAGDSIARAQERSTELLLSRLPPPPSRLLEVGIGLGRTMSRLVRSGYEVEGITPDEQQIAMVRAEYGDALNVRCTRFEEFVSAKCFDTIFFQESSQYIDADALFAKAREFAPRVVVLDEFALRDEEGATLHRLDTFLEAAGKHAFRVIEELDLSEQAAPTVDYFNERIPVYRNRLIADLALTGQQLDDLVASGRRYRELYARGVYGYRLLVLER